MDMVGNIAPQIFNEGATEDKGEMARLVSTLTMDLKNSASKFGRYKIIQKNIMINFVSAYSNLLSEQSLSLIS